MCRCLDAFLSWLSRLWATVLTAQDGQQILMYTPYTTIKYWEITWGRIKGQGIDSTLRQTPQSNEMKTVAIIFSIISTIIVVNAEYAIFLISIPLTSTYIYKAVQLLPQLWSLVQDVQGDQPLQSRLQALPMYPRIQPVQPLVVFNGKEHLMSGTFYLYLGV